MTVLIIGATGFTGTFVTTLLLERFGKVRCLARPSSDTSTLRSKDIEIVLGDLDNPSSLDSALEGIETMISLASLGFGHGQTIVSAARTARVRRAVFLSTTAVFTSVNAKSKSVRLQAEEAICRSGLNYTILRPTMIYGSPADRNMSRLIRYLISWPIIPIFGAGKGLQQPVFVEDVALAVRQVLESPRAINKCYNISGGTILTLNEVIDTICTAVHRRVLKFHLPRTPFVALLEAFERVSIRLPLSAEQIKRLDEDKAFDYSAAGTDFQYTPRSFAEGIRLELEAMGLV